MSASLHALLAGIVDYAGLFPPARLPLDEAIRNHARYRSEPESWMLGRFVCPAERLHELSDYRDLFSPQIPLAISALGRGGTDAAAFRKGFEADLEAILRFREEYGEAGRIDGIELRLPPEFGPGVLADVQELGALVSPGLVLFFELPPVDEWDASVARVVEALGRLGGSAGFKLRCGGADASAIPSVQRVASILLTCHERGVPFKATAGLHHPLRHFSREMNAPMHGFLNVFAAGVFARARGFDLSRTRQVLEDETPGHFVFTDEGLSWQGATVTTVEIADARRRAVLSFGSCSFDEPRDDLRALGLLGEA
jgi:hypothetical protein